MDRGKRLFAFAFVSAAVAACGSSTGGSGAAGNDVPKYRELVAQAQSAASTYAAAMVGPTGADCQKIQSQYDAQVRPLVSQIVQDGSEMDALVTSRRGGTSADVKCVAATMLDEVNFHASIACTMSDLGANQAEAGRHADAMNSLAYRLLGRCDEIQGASTQDNWGPVMSGCENWSSTCCSTMMRSGCCGGLMGRDGMSNGETCCGTGG